MFPPTAVIDLMYGGLGGWVGVHLHRCVNMRCTGSSDEWHRSHGASEQGKVTNLSLSTSHCDIHEPPSVCYPLLGAAFRGLLLLLGFDLFDDASSAF